MKRHLIPVILSLLCILFSCDINEKLERTNPIDPKAGANYKPPPTVTTQDAVVLSSTTATLNGTVNANNASATVTFDYGLTISYGSSANATQSPVTGTTVKSVSKDISGLTPNQTYHFRVKASSLNRTPTFGSDKTFKTYTATVSDNDGNNYNAITIGTQVWLNENLKTTKYNDGTSIPVVTDGTAWTNLTTAAYCWYNNNQSSYKTTYGALYNWYTVTTDKLCPSGYRVPTDAEWTTLTTYLGGENSAGGKLKETGTTHWLSPNAGVDNLAGFTALPGGGRNFDGQFLSLGNYGYWWSSTTDLTDNAWNRGMSNSSAVVTRNYTSKKGGFSVRCVKN